MQEAGEDEQRCSSGEPTDERNIRTDHRILHRVGKHKEEDEVNGSQLCRLAAADQANPEQ
jgi:hypothetical protein